MENLENTITAISDSIGIVGNGVNESATASNDLAKRTEMQAPNLEETSATLGQITMIISRSAGSAKEASEAATTVRMDAAKSSLIVNDGVAAMERIKDTAKAMAQIMGMIDEIAFQTNIFALNAGVEAARAGDSGRGFAVVASEVRILAQCSAEASREIRAFTSGSALQVEHGVVLIDNASEALNAIVTQMTQIDTLISEIAMGSREQAVGLPQVNEAVSQLDQVMQQNAAMVEQAIAAANSLETEARQLMQLIDWFKISSINPIKNRILELSKKLQQVVHQR